MARPSTAAVRLLSGEREPVRLATTGHIEHVGLPIIDGTQTAVGDRILDKDNDDSAMRGIYTAGLGEWYRAPDARSSRALQRGVTVYVQEGATNRDKTFIFTATNPVIGVDPITCELYFSRSDISAITNQLVVRPEMFGASRDKSVDSTSALLDMVDFVNTTGAIIELSAIYRSTATLAFTCNGLVIRGQTTQNSGFVFDGCDGITLDHSGYASPTTRYRLEDFCILTTGQMLYKGFSYTGTDSGGGGMTLREIKGLHLCGEGYFDNNGVTGIESLPEAQRNAGWLVGIDLQYSDNTCVSNCRVHGSWQSYANSNPITNPKFPVETFGVRSEGSTGLYCTDVQVFFLRHGFRVFGSCENVKIVDCVAVACWKGVTITGLTGAANYIQVIRTHAAVWEWGINIDTAMMHVVRDNLIFSMGDQDYYGILFRGIVFGGFRSIISGNHIYCDPADDPSLNVDVAMDITSNVNIISENHFQHFDNLLRISGSTNTAVNNTSSQSVNIGTVLPVEDTGAGNMFANNAGDQSGYWPAIRIQTKTVATLTAESKNVGKIAVCSDEVGGTTIVFADGTNWRRVQDRAVMS